MTIDVKLSWFSGNKLNIPIISIAKCMTFFFLVYSPLRCTCQIIQKLHACHILHQQINRGRTGSIPTGTSDDKLYNNNQQCAVAKHNSDDVNLEFNMQECGLKWECRGEYRNRNTRQTFETHFKEVA